MTYFHRPLSVFIVFFSLIAVLFLAHCSQQPEGNCNEVSPQCQKAGTKYNKSSGTYLTTWKIYPNCSGTFCLEWVNLTIQAPYGSKIVGAYLWGTSLGTEPGYENVECYINSPSATSVLNASCYVLGTSYQLLEVEHTSSARPYISGRYTLCH